MQVPAGVVAVQVDGLAEQVVRDLPDGLKPGMLAGEPVMVSQGFALLEADGRRLGTWSTLLLGLTILICFRSLRWLIVPIAIVQWSLVVTQALLVVGGLQLSMVSSMLTAIVTVVGVATVMHLIVHFRELRVAGRSPRDASGWSSSFQTSQASTPSPYVRATQSRRARNPARQALHPAPAPLVVKPGKPPYVE